MKFPRLLCVNRLQANFERINKVVDKIKKVQSIKKFTSFFRCSIQRYLSLQIEFDWVYCGYPPAKAELLKHGISSDGKRAVQLCFEDYDKYDLFIGMDSANIRNMQRILCADKENKIRKLLQDRDVSDPWYSDRFDIAYDDILSGCLALLKELKNGEIK